MNEKTREIRESRLLLMQDRVYKLYPLISHFDTTQEQKEAIRFLIDLIDYECYGITPPIKKGEA